MLRAVIALVLSSAACSWPASMPAHLEDLPGEDAGLDRRSWQARRLFEAGQPQEALAVLDGVLRDAPDHVDAHRVRQDILRERGRMGLLLWEAEDRLARHPADPAAHYLAGRLARTDDEKLLHFRRATELAPRSFWGWLGVAYVLRTRDPAESLAIYRRLYEASNGHPLAAIALASVLRTGDPRELGYPPGGEHLDDALRVYERLRGHPLAPGVGDLGMAQTDFLRDKLAEAWPALLSALKLRPFDPAAQEMILQLMGRGLPEDQLNQVLDVLHQDESRVVQLVVSGGAPLLAGLLVDAGQPFAARAVLETPSGGPTEPALRRRWQQLLLQTGEVRGFLDSVRRGFPAPLLADERNRVRGLWVRLLTGPWMDTADPLARADVAAALVEALLRCGMLEEAEQVAGIALLRHGADPTRGLVALRDLREEARAELSFERALRRVLYRGYARHDREQDLDHFLEQLRRISVETFDEDVVGEPRRWHVPLVGDLLDPFGPGLFEHLARYNQHLVLGQRSAQPPEGMMLRRLSVRELEPSEDLPLSGPSLEVVGENRSVRSLSGVYGGDLAGVALINHTVIDMDSVRQWAGEIRDRRQIVREDGGLLLDDPLPEVSPLDPASVHWRLSMLSPVEDSDLDEAVLEMIRWHERAHLVDATHFLPPEGNLWRVLGLLLGHGFSRASVEAEVEARAETAALALSPHTRLVLAHIAVFLEGDAVAAPHAVGFRRLARRLGERLRAAGLPAAVSRWHLLEPATVRAFAREMLQEQW